MKRIPKIIFVLISVLLLGLSFAALFHQHHGDEDLLNCQNCHFLFQTVFLAVVASLLVGLVKKNTFSFQSKMNFLPASLISSLQTRAPPSLL